MPLRRVQDQALLLWLGKFTIGAVLVVTQALAVAAILGLLSHEMPRWVTAIIGNAVAGPRPGVGQSNSIFWLLILPVVTLEAFAWGLLGSSLTKRVLAGAALAALCFTPVLLLALCAPAEIFFGLRLVLAAFCLGISCASFLGQTRETTRTIPIAAEGPFDAKEEFLDRWTRYERDDGVADDKPLSVPASALPLPLPLGNEVVQERHAAPAPFVSDMDDDGPEQPHSPSAALGWLTFQQAWPVVCFLGSVSLLIGFLIPANAQVLWPLATLLLGVACGTAAFAPEQRDLSCQFLAAQHLPLKLIWRFKIVFWLAVAVLAALVMLLGAILSITMILLQRQGQLPPGIGFQGTLHDRMGPTLFFGVWLMYGFCSAQLVVWYCRKSVLALLVSSLVAMAAISLWLPALLCGGMSGWQVWLAPLTTLSATWCLMRAWASGRIWERKPVAALVGFAALATLWASLWFGYRAWIIPDVGEPLDPIAFKATFPTDNNTGANAIQRAITKLDNPNDGWLEPLADVTRLPIGILEFPSSTGNLPGLQHLPTCSILIDRLLRRARESEPDSAFEHLAQVLALSRNLRNKASLESYLAGVQHEESALKELDKLLDRGKPTPKLLRDILDELNRHANDTPPPLDCIQTECFRSAGVVDNPIFWSFAAPGGKVRERWLVGGIALSLEAPWESERKMRLWQLVWAGLFRAIETPHWELPRAPVELPTENPATRTILEGWLPDPASSVSRADIAGWLDASWLADDRLFCSVTRLRNAATRARWRVDATRLAIALALYRMEEGQPARTLSDLGPRYLPAGLPPDPYSGQSFHYRTGLQRGPATLWSTGPDAIDHGGRKHGGHLPDNDPHWSDGDFDLIMLEPHWP